MLYGDQQLLNEALKELEEILAEGYKRPTVKEDLAISELNKHLMNAGLALDETAWLPKETTELLSLMNEKYRLELGFCMMEIADIAFRTAKAIKEALKNAQAEIS